MHIDKNNDGFLEKAEVSQALKDADIEVSSDDLNRLFEELDLSKNNKINYCDFLSATLDINEECT